MQNQIKNILIGNHENCYSGYAGDEKIRFNASSGGLITALLVFALEKKLIDGAVVVRPGKNNILVSEAFIARTREEIISASGSRYCPLENGSVLKEIISSKKEEKLAFVGLPCQIYGVKKALLSYPESKGRIVLFIGLFCGGRPGLDGLKFFLKRNKISEDEIKKINFRGSGWPGVVKIFKKNGAVANFKFPFFWSIAGSSLFYPKSCMACSDCTSEEADLSFGDAWLDEFKDDKIGRSLVISRNKDGADFLLKAESCGALRLEKIMQEKVIQSQIISIYLKKKCLRLLFKKSEKAIKPDFLDYILSRVFLINSKIGRNAFLMKIISFIPIKIVSLYEKIFSKILYKKAVKDFNRHI